MRPEKGSLPFLPQIEMKTSLKDPRGLTLIEILVSLGLTASLMTAALSLYRHVTDALDRDSSALAAAMEADFLRAKFRSVYPAVFSLADSELFLSRPGAEPIRLNGPDFRVTAWDTRSLVDRFGVTRHELDFTLAWSASGRPDALQTFHEEIAIW